MNAKALWHINQNESELREESLKVPVDSSSTMISTSYSMLSTGTEFSVSSGLVSNQFLNKMAVPYMEGDFSFPIKYGYACSGVDSDNNLFHFMHPHQSRCIIKNSDLFEITSLSEEKVPLISNMETVLNAIWDSDIQKEDSIAILGYGNVGSLLAETIKLHYDFEVTVIEKDSWRSTLAQNNGFEVDPEAKGTYDVIFNTTSSSAALNQGLKLLDLEGRLVELSWYANKEVVLKLGEHFHYNRLRIISSQVAIIPLRLKGLMTYEKRKSLAANLLTNACYDKLITDVIDFEKSAVFFNDLRRNGAKKGLIYLFKY